MIRHIPAASRHHADFGWLSTYWHFSFDSYYDPANMGWGPLRVFNDDVIQPGQGFPMHGHRDMEIITIVLEGVLEHRDSIGSRHLLRPHEVQVMSAGRGIRHSEFNASPTDPLHLLQIWIQPRRRGLEPRWQQKMFPVPGAELLPVVSSGNVEGTLAIDQDATIYRAAPAAGQRIRHGPASLEKAYLFLISGEVALNGIQLAAGDQARLEAEQELVIEALAPSEFLLIDLPHESRL